MADIRILPLFNVPQSKALHHQVPQLHKCILCYCSNKKDNYFIFPEKYAQVLSMNFLYQYFKKKKVRIK